MAEKKWKALDHCSKDQKNEADATQDGKQKISTKQQSKELIFIKDSEDISVQTTDTQASISLQVALQAAIVAVISITIGDTDRSKAISQDLLQGIKTKQANFQKTVIEKSKNVTVTTTDTDISANIQALLQVLIAVVVRLDVL